MTNKIIKKVLRFFLISGLVFSFVCAIMLKDKDIGAFLTLSSLAFMFLIEIIKEFSY